MKSPIKKIRQACRDITQIKSTTDHVQFWMNNIYAELGEIRKVQEEQKQALLKQEKINDIYFNALFKKGSETDLETRKRFFSNMPPADGDSRTIQDGDLKLIKAFDEICSKHKLTYWVDGGTLLGAIRHGGFIPWDDDIDVYMSRDDIEKLKGILEDTEYRITTVYSIWNVNKEIRFKTKNPANPCFIDLFIYDYVDRYEPDDWKKWLETKQKIIEAVQNRKEPEIKKWKEKTNVSEDTDPEIIPFVEKVFNEYYGGIGCPVKKVLGIETTTKAESVAIMWSLDNLYPIASPQNSRIYKNELIFPLKRIKFEDTTIFAPKDFEKYLSALYGDYYKIPEDLVSHFKHIVLDDNSREAIRQFLK